MDASRLMAMLQPLLASHEDLAPSIYKLAQRLKGATNADLLLTEAEIIDRLERAESNDFVPSWLRMLHSVGGDALHGRPLARRINAILENPDYRREHKGTLLEGVYQDLAPFMSNVRSLLTSLESLGVSEDEIPEGSCEIGVLFPPIEVKDLEDLAREIREFDKHMRVISELAGNAGSLSVRRVEKGSVNLFSLADPAVGSIVAALLAALVTLVKKVAEIRKIAAETRKINVEVAEKLEQQAVAARKAGIEDIAAQYVTRDVATQDPRRNELDIALTHTIAYLDAKIQMNVVFEVRASASAEAAGEAIQTALQVIRQSGNALAEFSRSEWQLLLARAVADKLGA